MKRINNQVDFYNFVERVAANNIERDGSSAKYVAESVITSIEVFDEDTAVLTIVGGDYSNTRITPTDVLRYTVYDVDNPKQLPSGYRRAAVVLLANEIREAQRNYRKTEDE